MPENEVPVVQKFDLEELIYNFHQCGIHVVVQTSNVGLMLTITDRLAGSAENNLSNGQPKSTARPRNGCMARR